MKLVNRKTVETKGSLYWDMTIPKNHNYVLANGNVVHNTGVGFSVNTEYTNKLPVIAEEFFDTDTCIVVADSKLGWAKALRELISLLVQGLVPTWDVSKIRPAGAPLKTFGGRASGPEPLVDLFNFVVQIFKNSAGRKLKSIECHDIVCKIAEIVVVGGVRRSALISLSELTDEQMRHAKSGQWWEQNVQRALANNSVDYKEKPDIGTFMREWLSLYDSKSGERGIYNSQAAQKQVEKINTRYTDADGNPIMRREAKSDFGTNPCSEIILRSREFCNLSEVVIRSDDTLETLKEKVRIATILGTFQSTLTNFKYLSKEWQKNCEEERLLGVSLTGIMDNPLTNGKEDGLAERLQALRDVAYQTNVEWSEKLNIKPSAAITAVKPSGCASLDTVIKTDRGNLSMAEIFNLNGVEFNEFEAGAWFEPSTELKVFDENNDEQTITKLYVNGIRETFKIEDEDGNIYKFTAEHKIKTQRGWVRADELKVEDEIIEF